MGLYRITIEATGGHGCDRGVKDGGQVFGCGRMGCPDCETRRFVERLQKHNSLSKATLEHWPGQPSQVTDDLLTKKRQGSF